jgi:aspartate/methionine/tyrosine aminotransferase
MRIALQAGFFVWMDLSKKLGIEDWDRECDIWGALFEKAKIYLVPGQCCHAQSPGCYRICFCAHPPEATHDMMARLQHFIDQYKVKEERQNWNTQGFMLAAGFGMR